MKEHQLLNNCYTICESTKQCKELFDWAKANGVQTKYDNYEDENCLAYQDALITSIVEDCIKDGFIFMPLDEFIAKLKGKWEQPNEVTEPDYKALYTELLQGVKDAIVEIRDNSNMAASLMLSKSDKSYGYISEGMDDAISILKRKTGVFPL
jgi:hypothetical protein